MNLQKDKLNYITISGVMNGKRCIENLSYNGLVQIDIDCRYKGGNFAASQIKEYLIQKAQDKTLPYIVMCAISPSALGVKCIVSTNNYDKNKHNAVLESVKYSICEILKGIDLGFDTQNYKIDKTNYKMDRIDYEMDRIDSSKPCFIPYDRNAYFNDLHQPFQYTHIEIEKAIKIKESKYVSDLKSIIYKDSTIELSVNSKMDMLESIVKKYNKYGTSRNCLVFALACKAKEHGVTCNECIGYCLNYCESDFAEREIMRVVNSAYSRVVKHEYNDFQLVSHAKKHNTYIPKDVLEVKPRLIAPQKSIESIALQNFKGEKGEYFSIILEKNKIQLTPKDICGVQWIVPTGGGKTNTIAKFSKENPTIIICPTKGLVNMCSKKYGAIAWHGDSHDIYAVLKSNFIATTYASFTTLCYEMQQKQHIILDSLRVQLYTLKKGLEAKRAKYSLESNTELVVEILEIRKEMESKQLIINELHITDILKRYHVFLDEFHNLVANASKGFQLEDLETILLRVKDCASFTGVTGTYLRNNVINMPIVNVTIPQNRIRMNVVRCETVRDSLIEFVIKSIQNKRFPIIFLNNTSNELERVKTLLGEYKIAYFNAHNKQDVDYEQLIDTSVLNENLQGIVTTSVMKEGIDINNNLNFDFFFVGRIHSSVIKQVIARARSQNSDVQAYLLRSLDIENNEDKRFNYDLERYELEKRSNCICDILNMTRLENSDFQISAFESDILRRFENLPIWYNEKSQRYEIRPLLFENHLYEIETTYETQNLNLLKENLAKLSVDLIDNSIENNAPQRDSKLCDDAVLVKKTKEMNEFDTILNEICKNPLTARQTIMKKYKENNISKIEKKTYKILKMCLDNGYKLLSVVNRDNENSIDVVKDLRELVETPTEKNFRAFVGILKTNILRNNELYMNNNSILAIQIKAFLNGFEGKTLTKEEIKAKVIDVMKLNKGVNIDVYNDASEKDNMRKFFDVLGLFFRMDRTMKKRGEYSYKFSLINLSIPKKGITEIKKEFNDIKDNDAAWFDFLRNDAKIGYDLTVDDRLVENVPF